MQKKIKYIQYYKLYNSYKNDSFKHFIRIPLINCVIKSNNNSVLHEAL